MVLRNVGSYMSHTANIPEDTTLHSHRREKLKFYVIDLIFSNFISEHQTNYVTLRTLSTTAAD
jgi:hypothetical protein